MLTLPAWVGGEAWTALKANSWKTLLEAAINAFDGTGLLAGSVALSKLNAAICTIMPIRMVAPAPGYDHASNSYSFNPGISYAGYTHDACSFRAQTAMTLTAGNCRMLRTVAIVPAGARAQVFIDGVAQAATILIPNGMAGNPSTATFNIAVTAGQLISLRLTGFTDSTELPLEYTLFAKMPLTT